MTTMSAGAVQDGRQWAPPSRTGGGFVNYLSLLREAFVEAMQQTADARRKYPFADV